MQLVFQHILTQTITAHKELKPEEATVSYKKANKDYTQLCRST